MPATERDDDQLTLHDKRAADSRRKAPEDRMGQYLPFADTHSIQEAVVAVHFRDEFPPDTVQKVQNVVRVDLRNKFPHMKTNHQLPKLDITQTGHELIVKQAGTPPILVGFELSKVKANATPARLIRFQGNALTVNFLEYSDWQASYQESSGYVASVLASMSLAANPVMALSLRYIDRYTFDGAPEEVQADLLLRKGSAYVTPYCFKVGLLWHSHAGWFMQLNGGDRVLNQLEIKSAMVDSVPTVTINHNAVCQLAEPRQSVRSLFEPGPNRTSMDDAFTILHRENDVLLRDVLQPAMLRRIGKGN